MTRFVPLLAFALLAACGLVDDERDDKNKRVYITFADPAFEAYCLEHFDIDHDGRISRYEAQRVLKMDCPDRGIALCGDRRILAARTARLQRQRPHAA
ncbi:MAG: hypothetical protein ACLRMJ_01565 [Alistipes finegoldii]